MPYNDKLLTIPKFIVRMEVNNSRQSHLQENWLPARKFSIILLQELKNASELKEWGRTVKVMLQRGANNNL